MTTVDEPTVRSTQSQASSLKEALENALPSGFLCNVRYLRTPPKSCDSLFSALPGAEPEKTRLSSHFLTVCVDPASVPSNSATKIAAGTSDVLSFAIEVLVYTTKRLTTIFVSKIDSTSYITRQRPSPVQRTATTFLRWLADEQLRKKPRCKVVISLFARAQAQYLFPGSSDERGGSLNKHVLDDRQLIKWWARVLDPILTIDGAASSSAKYQGYLTVPGYEGNELRRSFMPLSRTGELINPNWLPSHPLIELGQARGLPVHAPPRCLLPRFPDDPKARYIMELDEEIGISQESQVTASPAKKKAGHWTSVRDLRSFWETMEFRQECSSGRVVGFLWLVISPDQEEDNESLDGSVAGEDVASQASVTDGMGSQKSRRRATKEKESAAKKRRPALTGPIIPRAPRLKGGSSNLSNTSDDSGVADPHLTKGLLISQDGYDKAMQTLLNLDFANLDIAVQSSRKWLSEVMSTCRLHQDFAVAVAGTAKAEMVVVTCSQNGAGAVNDLGSMVRKKRRAGDADGPSSAAVSQDAAPANGAAEPGVNVLSAGMIRKKPKPAAT